MKRALIVGITGQDGSYLADFLLEKGYQVRGMVRRCSVANDERIRHLRANENFEVVQGDVTDALCVFRLIEEWQPDEIYNLAAMSHVKVSFDEPSHTTDVTYKGCLNILEAIRIIEAAAPAGKERIRFYQASSSEMFGGASSRRLVTAPEFRDYTPEQLRCLVTDRLIMHEERFQDETTPMLPCSPYAIAKLAAHHVCRLYREAYGTFACSGILFNHESERRGEQFVTRKITKYIARVVYGRRHGSPPAVLRLGNLEAKRDWGHAADYVRGMWLMLQQAAPDDYVLATGETHTVREFLNEAFKIIGVSEEKVGDYVAHDPSLFRPSEVPYLRGDATKACAVLDWLPEVTFKQLVRRMVLSDIASTYGEELAKEVVSPRREQEMAAI